MYNIFKFCPKLMHFASGSRTTSAGESSCEVKIGGRGEASDNKRDFIVKL